MGSRGKLGFQLITEGMKSVGARLALAGRNLPAGTSLALGYFSRWPPCDGRVSSQVAERYTDGTGGASAGHPRLEVDMKRSDDVRLPQTKTGVLLLGLLVGVSGCSATGPAGTTGRGGARNQITAEQIAELPGAVGTALNVIAELRPRWLRASRSQGTPGGGPALPMVFVDRTEWGALDSLEGIPIEEVERIEFLDMRDATTQYGTGYPGGIIRIVTRRGR